MGQVHKIRNSPFFHTIALTPELVGIFYLCNRNFPFPDSVPDTVTAGLYVRNVLIVLTDHIFMHIAIVVYAIASIEKVFRTIGSLLLFKTCEMNRSHQ